MNTNKIIYKSRGLPISIFLSVIFGLYILIINWDNGTLLAFPKQFAISTGICFLMGYYINGGHRIEIINQNILHQKRFWFFHSQIPISSIIKIDHQFINLGFTKTAPYIISYMEGHKIKLFRLGSYDDKDVVSLTKQIQEINPSVKVTQSHFPVKK